MIRLAAYASDDSTAYDSSWEIEITAGTSSGDTIAVSSYTGNTSGNFHELTVASPFSSTPDSTSVYELRKNTLAVTDLQAIYLWKDPASGGTDRMFRWLDDVDVVKGPVAGDKLARTYYTGAAPHNNAPKMTYSTIANTVVNGSATYPQDYYLLGIPAPVTKPTTTLLGTATDATDVPETRTYVYTYVSAIGEEGPPTAASTSLDWRPGQTVYVSAMDITPDGKFNITRKRIYRVNTGNTGAEFQFAAEIGVADTAWEDNVASTALAEVITSDDYDFPPEAMRGIVKMPNGMLVAFAGNELLFSEPFVPHAWPTKYRQTLPHDIVSLGVYGSTCVVTTKDEPWVAHGVHPDSVTLEKIEMPYPAISKRGTVDMGKYVLYPSADGLVKVYAKTANMPTENSMDPITWKTLLPASIKAYRWDDLYLAFYNDGAVTDGFFVDDKAGSDFVFLDEFATAGYVDPENGDLYLAGLAGAATISTWASGSGALTALWKSKIFATNAMVAFTVGRIDATAYNVTFQIWGDGVSKDTITVTSDQPFRITPGALARTHEVQVSGTNLVRSIEFATSMKELLDNAPS